MDTKNPHNHNPEGHNQYTKNEKKSGAGKASNSQQAGGGKGHAQKAPAHNPEGHNQYTK